MNKKLQLLLLSSISFTIIYLSFKLPNNEKRRITELGEDGIGTIYRKGLKTIEISYSYQGDYYVYTKGIPFSNLTEGEQYRIRIYKKDPSRILLYIDKPYRDSANYR